MIDIILQVTFLASILLFIIVAILYWAGFPKPLKKVLNYSTMAVIIFAIILIVVIIIKGSAFNFPDKPYF